jgi:hypothetical protein
MLLLRERWKHLWRTLGRPIGVVPGGAMETFARNYARIPRTPLWATALLLLASAAVLLHPEVRNALGSLYSSYAHTEWEPSQWSSVKKLYKIASSNRDPQLLALLSLLSAGDAERLRLSEEAIEKDASLTWLDYEQSLWPLNDLSQQHYLPAGRLERLQRWDPQNAVLHILAAEIISKPARVEAFDAAMHGKTDSGLKERLAQDAQWNSEMAAAFAAPKYDNYTSQIVQLIQDVSLRFGLSDPDVAVFVLAKKRMIQFEVVRAYADTQMDRAAAFERNANAASAITIYSQILRFSERMLLERQPPIEHYFAQGMGARACEKLQEVFQSTGRDSEASLVAFQLAEWKAEHDSKVMRYVPAHYHESQWNVLAWSGLQINLAAMGIVTLAPIALIGFSHQWARRKVSLERRGPLDFWASTFADGAPWLLLVSSLFLFLLYHPYAKLCGAFLSANQHAPDIESFVTAALVPHAAPETVQFARDPYSLWFTVTALLCLMVTWLIWRMVIQRKDMV